MNEKKPEPGSITGIPTIRYFDMTYGRSMENDMKACRVFKDYESREKLRRLQEELNWIKCGYVSETVCREIVGTKRKSRYEGGYEKWASLMLLWLNRPS